jgi:WhiB family redox-sensing transcriptional regulator
MSGATGVVPCQREPELFFAEQPRVLERAKELCAACPVRDICLAGALERREPHGVWGGQIFVDGVVVATKRGRGRPPKVA